MNPILQLDGICKSFGGVSTAKDVSFTLEQGAVYGLIGPNGAGKTTMMNMISGIYTPDAGKIFFEGKDITQVPAYKRARMGIGRTFQTPRFLYRSSIRDNLLVGTDLANQMGYWNSFRGKKGADFDQELQELLEVARLKLDWDEDIQAVPFGKRKLLEIVRSMLAHPKVMLVDEPAAGLNNKEIEYAMDLLNLAAKKRNIVCCSSNTPWTWLWTSAEELWCCVSERYWPVVRRRRSLPIPRSLKHIWEVT